VEHSLAARYILHQFTERSAVPKNATSSLKKRQIPMDILHIGLCLGHGGDAVQMLELAAGLAARGNRIRIVVPGTTRADFAERSSARGVSVEWSPLLRVYSNIAALPQNAVNLIRFFRSQRADLIHFHSSEVCLPRLVLLVMRLLRLPRVFVTIQSPYDNYPGDAQARAWANAVRTRVHRVICPSNHSLQAQLRFGVPPDRVLQIPNSVDVKRFTCGDGMRIRHELGIDAHVPLAVFTARLEAQKRPMDALKGFGRLKTDVPTAHLAFVGDGSLEDDLRSYVASKGLSDCVHFVGYRTDIPDWLAAATVWLLPTETENFSLGVLEALAAGCPILSTLCPGNDEVLVAGENALIHPIGDVKALAAGLRRLISDDGLRSRLSENARKTAEGFANERTVERYAACYQELFR
jgi:glycosyltransferase involved in cell wall biosynthesis